MTEVLLCSGIGTLIGFFAVFGDIDKFSSRNFSGSVSWRIFWPFARFLAGVDWWLKWAGLFLSDLTSLTR